MRIQSDVTTNYQAKLKFLGMAFVISLLLIGCSLLVSGDPDLKVRCPKILSSSKGQLCGIAVRYILGPADQIEEKVPLEGSEILIMSLDLIPQDEVSLLGTNPGLLCSRLKDNFASKEISVDSEGRFSDLLEPGEYLLCVSYSPSWAPSSPSHQGASLSISKTENTRISIVYSPMGGLFIPPIP